MSSGDASSSGSAPPMHAAWRPTTGCRNSGRRSTTRWPKGWTRRTSGKPSAPSSICLLHFADRPRQPASACRRQSNRCSARVRGLVSTEPVQIGPPSTGRQGFPVLSVPRSNVADAHDTTPQVRGAPMATSFDRDKALDVALAQIEKQHGKGSVMRLGERAATPIEVIPTGSIALDVALGIGGLPRGRVVEIYGPESSGKTSLALQAVANAQAAGGVAAFIDAEHALDPEYARKLGVDTDALLVSQPDTGEQALEIAETLVRSGALDVIVIDSVAALVPRAEIEGEMGDSHVGLQARLMSQALRKITGALNNSGTTAIFINQLREKIGVMFGCFSYGTRITLADGTQEKIGKIGNQTLPVA